MNEFITHVATVVIFSRAVSTTYFSHTLHTTVSRAHVFTSVDSYTGEGRVKWVLYAPIDLHLTFMYNTSYCLLHYLAMYID